MRVEQADHVEAGIDEIRRGDRVAVGCEDELVAKQLRELELPEQTTRLNVSHAILPHLRCHQRFAVGAERRCPDWLLLQSRELLHFGSPSYGEKSALFVPGE